MGQQNLLQNDCMGKEYHVRSHSSYVYISNAEHIFIDILNGIGSCRRTGTNLASKIHLHPVIHTQDCKLLEGLKTSTQVLKRG